MKNKYPSLAATLEPTAGGSLVRCTRTRAVLGHVWWTCAGGTTVTWHFRTASATGERATERNAVQALRDVANGAATLDFGDAPTAHVAPSRPIAREASTPPAPSTAAPTAAPTAPRAAPAVRPRIVWNDAAPAFDVTATIAAELARRK